MTCPLRNLYFCVLLTAPFGARIRFRAILHEGNMRLSAVFWFDASASLSYSLKGVFLLDVPCQITTFVLPGLLPLGPEFASEHSPWRNHEVQGGFLASCWAIAPVFLERDVFVTCPMRNHYFYSPLTEPFGARIRFRALLHEGNTRSVSYTHLTLPTICSV